ncbi:MAG: 16S rRNA (cytidine(1402)-2'-O)-methyltransferase [Flavobacteriales bacterium]|nr:16S rRNA (cytidine(1402)-2'-O)-methyltransferase [Flavobacteriales bacterium]
MTYRAIRVLREVDLILCEDTRQSSKLLKHYNIENKLSSYHMHNEHKVTPKYLDIMEGGDDIALITDAGTPGISDPGFLITRACFEHDVEVIALPGASSVLPALLQSGLPCDKFVFEGFLPPKKGRKSKIEALIKETRTVVFFESPHRILKTLRELEKYAQPNWRVSVSRELTKLHEETIRGRFDEVIQILESKASIKGEFVVTFNTNLKEKDNEGDSTG